MLTKRGAGTLTISGTQSHGTGAVLVANGGVTNLNADGGPNLSVQANANLNFGATQHLAGVTIGEGGRATLTPGGEKNLVTAALAIAGGDTPIGTLDLTDNAAIIDYSGTSSDATVRNQIIAGRGGSGLGKTWNGQGITSSTAAAILMRFTRTGDANLDGVVNNNDVTIVGANYAPGFAKPRWDLGDFDYNGFVDNDDVTLLGVYYNPSAAPIPAPAATEGVAAVPEPASWLMLTLGGLAAGRFGWRPAGGIKRALTNHWRQFFATTRR
jgi:hypothetical protein